jgi:Ca2+:H+ antiporter
LIAFPIAAFGYLMTWFWVVSIPMAKVIFEILKLLFQKPWAISITTDYNKARSHSVLLCTHQAFNASYLKHNVWGMNIVFFNLFPVVAVRVIMILVTMIADIQHLMPDMLQFALDLVCAIPITFYIGLAISSIAAQTNYMIGALLNASFGSITELTLYTLAIRRGSLDALILYSVTGGLLSDMLLLPGMSMIFGGIKFKEQKFNPVAAGVGSILLFIAIVGAFTPTIFYHAFGVSKESCNDCTLSFNAANGTVGDLVCTGCRFVQNDLLNDPLFMQGARYLQYFSAAVLPLAYFVGMFFTFKTHSHIFQEEESEHGEGGGEHEGSPEWPIWSSVILMLVSIAMFGLLAEDIVHVVEGVLKTLGVTQSFLGLTLIALTPAATELASAIKFALAGQINLSVEIGSASAIQISLIQMPALTAISTMLGATGKNGEPFNLIFPLLAVFAVMLAVITFNYISSEGKTNYFVGASMVIIYLILVASFYFVPEDPESGGDGGHGSNSTAPIAAHALSH